jgi:hypothetical protein
VLVEKLEEDMISKLTGDAKQSGSSNSFSHRDGRDFPVERSCVVAHWDFTSVLGVPIIRMKLLTMAL